MKKNITINLLGRLYAIDEDAYELLKRYTDSLRSYFGRREGGEEIVDDIEARIAELFDELKQGGTEAITIEHVQDIIHRVGSPEEMEESPLSTSPAGEGNPNEPEGNTSSKGEAGRGPRRLYRNMADRKFMGVLSGFSAYFGGDVLWWRIGYVVLFFLSMRIYYWPWNWYWSLNATLIVAYIVLGILMPVAETPEDRLRMKGKDVTPQNLADEVSQPQSKTEQSGHLGCIGGFFFMVGTLIRWFFYFVAIMIAFGLLSGIVGLLAAMLMPHSVIQISDSEFWKFFDGNYQLLIGAAIAALVTLLIPAYCIIHSLFNEFKLLQPMGFRQRFVLLITWLIAFVITAVIGMGLVGKVKIFDEMRRELRDKKWREENTHDGIYYSLGNYEYDFLTERGWRVTKAEDCNGRYTSDEQYYTGESGVRYIDTYDSRCRQIFTIERTHSLEPGHYQLSACVRADGQGAYLYFQYTTHKAGKQHTEVGILEIPADGNTGGGIWKEAKERRDSIDAYVSTKPETIHPSDYDHIADIADANDGKGFGWNRICITNIEIKQPVTLHYGVSTDPAITHKSWLGHWFSACDFELTRLE